MLQRPETSINVQINALFRLAPVEFLAGSRVFEDHSNLPLQDDVLARLLMFPNVIVTAREAFFTREAMSEIAQTTLDNVAAWQAGTPRNVVQAHG